MTPKEGIEEFLAKYEVRPYKHTPGSTPKSIRQEVTQSLSSLIQTSLIQTEVNRVRIELLTKAPNDLCPECWHIVNARLNTKAKEQK